MGIGTTGFIENVVLYNEYVREGITIKASVEVEMSQGEGFYIVFETDELARIQYNEFMLMYNQQWGIQ